MEPISLLLVLYNCMYAPPRVVLMRENCFKKIIIKIVSIKQLLSIIIPYSFAVWGLLLIFQLPGEAKNVTKLVLKCMNNSNIQCPHNSVRHTNSPIFNA